MKKKTGINKLYGKALTCQKKNSGSYYKKYIYIYVSYILKPTTLTQMIFRLLLLTPAMFTVHLALSVSILHSYGQALRNVTKLHKLYFVTDLGASPWLAFRIMNLYYIIRF